jgi:hypothetical protein
VVSADAAGFDQGVFDRSGWRFAPGNASDQKSWSSVLIQLERKRLERGLDALGQTYPSIEFFYRPQHVGSLRNGTNTP